MIRKSIVTLLLLIFVSVISTSVFAAYNEKSYVTSKSLFSPDVSPNQTAKFNVGSIVVAKGTQAKLKVILPPGVNQLLWEPFSNTFQYGVAIGNSPETVTGTSGSIVVLYNNLDQKSSEGVAYIYVDNSAGEKDFVASSSSKLRIYAKDDTTAYDAWCGTSCKASGGNTTTPTTTTTTTNTNNNTSTSGTQTSTAACEGIACLAAALSGGTTGTTSTNTGTQTNETQTTDGEGEAETVLVETARNAELLTELVFATEVAQKEQISVSKFKVTLDFTADNGVKHCWQVKPSELPEDLRDISLTSLKNKDTSTNHKNEVLHGVDFKLTTGFEGHVTFYPTACDEDAIKKDLKAFEGTGIQTVFTKDGWLLFINQLGVTYKGYFADHAIYDSEVNQDDKIIYEALDGGIKIIYPDGSSQVMFVTLPVVDNELQDLKKKVAELESSN